MATKTAKKDKSAVDFDKAYTQVKNTVSDVNTFLYETTEDAMEGAIARGAEWQNLTGKAIKGGFRLATKQQDIVFDTLESVKVQLVETRKRFKNLFSNN